MFRITIHGDDPIARVEPEVYGHFAEHLGGVIYDGIWVGEDSEVPNIRGMRKEIIDKMKAIHAPLIRWPGGCYAEGYDWKDGIGPREKRPTRINWWNYLDGRFEPNAFGTDEFMDFCACIGAKPYLAVNVTTMTPMDARNWLDYCNSPEGSTTYARLRAENGHPAPYNVRYWGIGNETYGGGGNMTGEMYAHEYRKYAVVLYDIYPNLEYICAGAGEDDWHFPNDVLRVIESSARRMTGLSLHYYCGGYGDAQTFDANAWYKQMRSALDIETAIRRNWGFVTGYGLEKHARLAIDEWGVWNDHHGKSLSARRREYGIAPALNNPANDENLWEQQCTMCDAMVTAITLNCFHNNAEKIKLATVAQLVNCLHSLFLADGKYCICTPTYHVFDMMQYHMGGEALRVSGNMGSVGTENAIVPNVSVSATTKDGMLTVTVANLSMTDAATVSLGLSEIETEDTAQYITLTSPDPNDANRFEEPDKVSLTYTTGAFDGNITVAPFSVVTIRTQIHKEQE